MTSTIAFPGLGLSLEVNRVAFTLFGVPIYWYGVIIAAGFLLAVAFAYRKAPQFGVVSDTLIDMLLFAVPLAIIGARLYYIIFYLDLFRVNGKLSLAKMVDIRDGGLAIYGGIIAAAITVVVFCKVRKFKVGPYLDLGAFGLLIGQAIGRWGNFFNVEAYGGETSLPWRMGIYAWNAVEQTYVYQEVHPTFLYECLWNVLGFALLLLVAKKWRKFDGQVFLSYVAWYGLGRMMIEGLRADSLYFFGLTLFGMPIRTSQVLAAVSALVSIILLVYHLKFRHHTPEELLVNQKEEVSHDLDGGNHPGNQAESGAG